MSRPNAANYFDSVLVPVPNESIFQFGRLMAAPVASWFETHRVAVLLTMRVSDLILRSGLLAASRRMKPLNRKLR
jgi:hypothetical protein